MTARSASFYVPLREPQSRKDLSLIAPSLAHALLTVDSEYEHIEDKLRVYDQLASDCLPAVSRVFGSLGIDRVANIARAHAAYRMIVRRAELIVLSFILGNPTRMKASVRLDGLEEFSSVAQRTGLILASPHFGPFVMMAPMLASLGFRCTVVGATDERNELEILKSEFISPTLIESIDYIPMAPGVSLSLMDKLRSGNVVLLYTEICTQQERFLRPFAFGDAMIGGSSELGELARLAQVPLFSGHIACRGLGEFAVSLDQVAASILSREASRAAGERLWLDVWRLVRDRPECWWGWKLALNWC